MPIFVPQSLSPLPKLACWLLVRQTLSLVSWHHVMMIGRASKMRACDLF